MQIFNAPEAQPNAATDDQAEDPLHRFRNWRGFLAAAIAVNLLFTYGMWNNTADPSVAIWFKVLVWLPFNTIATTLYIVFLIKLGKSSEANNHTGGVIYTVLCVFLILANWVLLFAA
jgi:hypothetical protein